jgi:TatD DNase family protein
MPGEAWSSEPYCSVGLHPWYINAEWKSEMDKVHTAAAAENVLFIGETGLDKLRGADSELQEAIFIEHIRISESVGKPLIIHCVKAFDEIIALRKKMRPQQQWIIHGFRGKPQQAQQLLDNGFQLSFGEHFNADSLTLAFHRRSLWLETDESPHSIEEIYYVRDMECQHFPIVCMECPIVFLFLFRYLCRTLICITNRRKI